MKELNILRLNAGLPIDSSIEITEKPELTETVHLTESVGTAVNDFWVVGPANAHTDELSDILHRTNTGGLIHYIIGAAKTSPKTLDDIQLFGGADKAAAQKEANKRLRTVQKEKVEAEEQLAAKDFDGDGKLETSSKEYKDSKNNAIKAGSENEEVQDLSSHVTVDGGVFWIGSDSKDVEAKPGQEITFTNDDKQYIGVITNRANSKNDALQVKAHPLKENKEDDGGENKEVCSCCKGGKCSHGEGKCKKCGGTGYIQEAMHSYVNVNKSKDSWEDDDEDAVNVVTKTKDAHSHDKPAEDKDESPTQLKALDTPSKQDQSGGNDLERELKVPASILKSLKDQEVEAEKESKKLNVSNRDAANFYNDLARAFKDLRTHLEGGTVHDMKLAQVFMTSLMGPMLHKIPADVVNYIVKGGQQRSLKSYMSPVDKKYPITGPRNALK